MKFYKIYIFWTIFVALLLFVAADLISPGNGFSWWKDILMLNAGAIAAYLAGATSDTSPVSPKVLVFLTVAGAPAAIALVGLAIFFLPQALIDVARDKAVRSQSQRTELA